MLPQLNSANELTLVQHTLDLVSGTQSRFESLMRDVSWHPIPFFGSLASARILTFGLNPSAGEFAVGRGWPARLSADLLTNRLVGYFVGLDVKQHPWFRAWAEALALLGASYQSDTAHVDLSPRPTASARTFSKQPEKGLFLEMLKVDAPIWIHALNAAPNAQLILMAGSATNKYYINEFIQAELGGLAQLSPPWKRGSGEGQSAFQDLVLSTGRKIPVFFCSSGPAKPAALFQSISVHAPRLKEILAGR